MLLRLVMVLLAVGVGGCATAGDRAASGTSLYFGLLRVRHPAIDGDLIAHDVTSIGLSWDRGVHLGWRQSQELIARPEDCRVVFIIRRNADLRFATEMAARLGERPCLADFSSQQASPPP